MTEMNEFECITRKLMSLIPKAEFERLDGKIAEFSHDFVGFVDIYYYLSKVIPKDWSVIDFGAGYNAQSYFFTEHKEYIAVNPQSPFPDDDGMFCPPNCKVYRMTTGQFLKDVDYPRERVFAICNYVPNWYDEDSVMLVHENFRDCYTFYPEFPQKKINF